MKIHTPYPRRTAAPNAFTLIEMVLVLAIIALLVGAALTKLTGLFGQGQETRAKMDITKIEGALRLYQMKSTFLPTTDQTLKSLVEKPATNPIPRRWEKQMNQVPIDPWGFEYLYRRPGIKNPESFDIYSVGKDGIEGTEDDVGNWE